MAEVSAPVKGTRPEGAVTEADASRKVREMFTQIAPRYDLLNHLLSLQLDRLWRARAAKRLRPIFLNRETCVLDLCCGTGDLAIAVNGKYRTRVVAVDFLVTTAFGFRNLANYESGLREIQRVLKPGGTIAILEFAEPPDGFLGDLYRFYCRTLLPRIGGFISGDRAAYAYLPKSVARFFRPPELASLLSAVGFQAVDYRVWTFGTVALHTAVRPR